MTLHLNQKPSSVRRVSPLFYDAWVCYQAQQTASFTKEQQRPSVPVLWRKAVPLNRQ